LSSPVRGLLGGMRDDFLSHVQFLVQA
jgi:hypothetical protein